MWPGIFGWLPNLALVSLFETRQHLKLLSSCHSWSNKRGKESKIIKYMKKEEIEKGEEMEN